MKSCCAVIALFVMSACSAKDKASAEPPAPAAPDSATVQAGIAAVALAQAAVAAAAAASAATSGAPAPIASAAPAAVTSAAPAVKPVVAAEGSGFSAQVANQLGRLGFSTGANDLVALGRDQGQLLVGLGRLAGHASALSAIFNSDKVVSTFMKRSDVQELCRNPERLKQVLSYALSAPAARAWVEDPASIQALTGSKLGVQFQACPAFQALARQPRSLALLTRESAQARAVVNHPNFRTELERLKIRQEAAPERSFRRLPTRR